MNRHSIRRNHGHSKGQFVSSIVNNWRNKVRVSKNKSTNVQSEVIRKAYENSGRRVVDFRILGRDLWCNVCDIPLSLRNIQNEQQFGLASKLDVLCVKYNENRTVETNARQANHRLYDVNSKVAIAMIDAGIGVTQLNTLLSALNIPTLSHTLVKRYERLVGPAIETVAENSCRDSIQIEKAMSIAAKHGTVTQQIQEPLEYETGEISSSKNQSSNDPEEPIDIAVSVDAGWQKRGSGRAYNSLSGHLSSIGHLSKKVLGYAVRSKACVMCSRGHTPDDHDCRKNYDGSAKSMEPPAQKK